MCEYKIGDWVYAWGYLPADTGGTSYHMYGQIVHEWNDGRYALELCNGDEISVPVGCMCIADKEEAMLWKLAGKGYEFF